MSFTVTIYHSAICTQTSKQTKLLLPFETVSVFADLLSSPNLVHLSCVGVSVQSLVMSEY